MYEKPIQSPCCQAQADTLCFVVISKHHFSLCSTAVVYDEFVRSRDQKVCKHWSVSFPTSKWVFCSSWTERIEEIISMTKPKIIAE